MTSKWLTANIWILVFALLAGGVLFYRAQKNLMLGQIEKELQAVINLKAGQLVLWRSAYLEDAAEIMENPSFIDPLVNWMAGPQTVNNKDVQALLRSIEKYYSCTDVILADTDGKVLLSLTDSDEKSCAEDLPMLTEALRECRPALTDLHASPAAIGLAIHMDIIAPLVVVNEKTKSSVGAIILKKDALEFFYPIFNFRDRTGRRTAEVQLVRRDGDAVLSLNDLLFHKDAALKLRFPLSRTDLPAVMAVTGREGFVKGKSPRGVNVLAALKHVPDSPWFLVAQMDEKEALESLYLLTITISALFLVMTASAWSISAVTWNKKEKAHAMTLLTEERQRRETEEQFRTLFETSSDALMIVSPSSATFLSCNRTCLKLFGVKSEAEFSSLTPWDLSPERQPDGRTSIEKAKELIGKAMSGGSHFFEWMHKRLGGEEFPSTVLLTLTRIKGEIAIQATVRDISEHKRDEQKLLESQRQIEFVLGATKTGLDIIDSQFNLRYVDPHWAKIYGNWSGRKCYDYFMDASAPCTGCGVSQVFETKQMAVTEEIMPKEGNRPVRVISIPYQDINGEWLFAEVNVDITEQKKKEDALRESERRFMDVLYASDDAILLINDNTFVDCNEATARMLGYATRQEFLQTHPSELSPPEQPDGQSSFEKAEEMMRLAFDKGYKRFEWIHRRANGESFPVEASLTPIVHEGQNLLYCVWRDITQHKRAEEEREILQAQLTQAQKMESVGRLAAGVAHEINNPTGFVSSNLTTLSKYQDDIASLIGEYRRLVEDLKGMTDSDVITLSISKHIEEIEALSSEIDVDFVMDDIKDLMKESREGLDRIKKIVVDLKDFAHPGEDELKTVNIISGLESTLNVVWNELKYKATVLKDYSELPLIEGYPQELNQVFMNILINAAQAIPDKGEIRISTALEDGFAAVRISDNGIGIPEKNIDKIFDPFFTTKPVGQGTGLGMNVAYNIVRKHNGTINIASEVGKGTTFTIRLPVCRQ